MAGYSGTPLPKKLGIKDGSTVLLMGKVPKDLPIRSTAISEEVYDVILLFLESAKQLAESFPDAHKKLRKSGGLWLCWPKRSSGVVTDLTENVLRDHALAAGLVDNKVCAVDETWSGLRVVYRLVDR